MCWSKRRQTATHLRENSCQTSKSNCVVQDRPDLCISPEFQSTDMPDVEIFWKVRRARRERDVQTLVAALHDETQASPAVDYLG